MAAKEATARIKINKLLEEAGWRFFPEGNAPANIRLEAKVTIKTADLDALGENFEKVSKGYLDFLLLDAKGFPLIVLEAKSEDKNPLAGKEPARKYAKSQNCRFIILSNGNLHYFWDLERGNPYVITSFPTPDSVTGYQKVTPNPQRLIADQVGEGYIVLTQRPNYQSEAGWRNEVERPPGSPSRTRRLPPSHPQPPTRQRPPAYLRLDRPEVEDCREWRIQSRWRAVSGGWSEDTRVSVGQDW